MARPRKKRLRYQFSLGGLILFSAALCISFGLIRHAVLSYEATDGILLAPPPINLLSSIGAAVFLGGAIGAAIGHFFRDERGGAGLMGAYIGAVIAVSLLAFGLAIYGVMNFGFQVAG